MGVETGSGAYRVDGSQGVGVEAVSPGMYRMAAGGIRYLGGRGLTGAFAPNFGSDWAVPTRVTSSEAGREAGGATA